MNDFSEVSTKKLSEWAYRIFSGFLVDKRPEFCEIIRQLAKRGVPVDEFYSRQGGNRNPFRYRGIPKRLESASFENFDVSGSHGLAEFLKACKDYVSSFEEVIHNGSGMTILGRVGTGKTHLACSIGNALASLTMTAIEKKSLYLEISPLEEFMLENFRFSHGYLYVNLENWLSEIQHKAQQEIRNNSETSSTVFSDIQGLCDFTGALILDEVFALKETPFCRQALQKIISNRYDHMLSTIIISNRSVDEVKNIDEMIASRILSNDNFVITIIGDDYRGVHD